MNVPICTKNVTTLTYLLQTLHQPDTHLCDLDNVFVSPEITSKNCGTLSTEAAMINFVYFLSSL